MWSISQDAIEANDTKEKERKKAIAAFLGWANGQKNKFGKEVKADG